MTLHTLYERSRLSGFRVEDILKIFHEKLISSGGVTIFDPGVMI